MTAYNLATVSVNSAGITIATTAYTDGDQVGTLIPIVMASAAGVIMSAVLGDSANIIGAFDVFLYDRSISLATDNLPDSISDTDKNYKLGVLNFPYPTTQGLNRTAHLDSVGIPYIANAANTIYAQFVTRGPHTFFGAATDLMLKLNYGKDI